MFWRKEKPLDARDVAKTLVENGYSAGLYGNIRPLIWWSHKTEKQVISDGLADSLRNMKDSSQKELKTYLENLRNALEDNQWVNETVSHMEKEKMEAMRSRIMIAAIHAEKDREPAFFQLLEASNLKEVENAGYRLGVATR